ncbi:DMT family transporter [Microbacterium sp. SSM24]|uniref:DMT family transporter n=1 Tax=Microbacterium sp. SSM24 TaxID=2991714 RepID=UPI002226DAF6|nr:DMT family transporter [Microbacterium sp. SSM24]MCW3491986.1 DMT family transporter [Microbacterium sp. SSM24]
MDSSSAPRRMPAWLALGFAVSIGVMTAVQARINGQLGIRVDDGFVAAVVSFGSGLVILVLLSAALPSGRAGVARLVTGVRTGGIPWWMLAGGAAGALTVATQGLAVGLIGVSLFTVGVVAGQTVNGLFLDRIGFGPAGVVAVTVPRLLGGALALGAVGLALVGDGISEVPLWMLVLPFLAGIAIAWQQATNGRLRQRVGTPLTATLVNFIGGTVLLAIAAFVHAAFVGPPQPFPTEPWLYLGGPVGVVYIFLSAAVVQYTGVLLLGLGAVVGQLLTSVAIDALWPAPAGPGLAQELAMVALALASVVVAAVPWGSRRR